MSWLRTAGFVLGPALVLVIGAKTSNVIRARWAPSSEREEPAMARLAQTGYSVTLPTLAPMQSFGSGAGALHFAALRHWLVYLGSNKVVRTTLDGSGQQDLLDTAGDLARWCRRPVAVSVDSDRYVWVTDFSGHLLLLDVAEPKNNPVRVLKIESGLTRLARFDTHLVSAPMLGTDLLRVFRVATPHSGALVSDSESPTELLEEATFRSAHQGVPFPGLVWQLGVFLNYPSMSASVDRARIALAFPFDSRINIHRSDGTLERAIAGPRQVKLDFRTSLRPGNPYHFIRTPQTTRAYTDVVVDQELILALFSGRSLEDYGPAYTSGDELHVFTWSGLHVGSWRLGVAVDKISMSPGSDTLFGLQYVTDARIVTFDISGIRSATREVLVQF